MKIEGKDILAAVTLAGGWLSILISGFVYALFWRVDNEPGYRGSSSLGLVAFSFCSLGGLAFLGGHIRLIIKKTWALIFITWGACAALLVGAITLLPVLLIFMV